MSLEEKRMILLKKKQKFESAMLIASIFLLLSFGAISPLHLKTVINVIIAVSAFGAGYLAGYYLPIRKWFNPTKC